MSFTLFSAMKNEAPFLLEWVAYHKAIGFDRIVIYSNDSDDGTTELLDALSDAGEVEHRLLTVPPGVGPQINAARHANRTGVLRPGDWVLWIDADEFLNIRVGDGTLPALLERVGDHDGILLQWRVFGDNGNGLFPGRLISADFTGASARGFDPNQEIKMLFRVTDRVAGFADVGINRPLLKPLPDNDAARFLNGRGEALSSDYPPTRRWLDGEDFPRSRMLGQRDFGWRMGQINHYVVRTPEHFALKKLRGRGWTPADRPSAERHNQEFYDRMNRNEERDDSILRFADAVTAGIARLRLNPAIGRAEFNAQRIVNARIQGMLAEPPEPGL